MTKRAAVHGGRVSIDRDGEGRFVVAAQLAWEPPPMIEVLLVDDDLLMRAGLRLIVQQTSDLTISGEAADGQQAVAAARRDRPDVVVMDVRMPVMDGIEATRQITAGTDPPHRRDPHRRRR